MNNNCDCIIPFYNEGQRVVKVVETVLKVKNLARVIVVDDGSDDKETYSELKNKFPKIFVIRLNKNGGKPNAIKEGLKYVTAQYVLTLDGDLTINNYGELDQAIDKITHNSQVDLIILRRVNDSTSLSWLRQDIVTSGQRILKGHDLKNIFISYPRGYQLEWAINTYMIKNKKKIYWMPLSINNIWRHQKFGFIGWKSYLTATVANLRVGIPNLIWQSLFFCHQGIK